VKVCVSVRQALEEAELSQELTAMLTLTERWSSLHRTYTTTPSKPHDSGSKLLLTASR
jgi:hypothetical protein